MTCAFRKPDDCGFEEICAFINFTGNRADISRENIVKRVSRCYLLGFCRENGRLIGITAVKRASRRYLSRISTRAGLPETLPTRREIGWAYTDPVFRNRGVATALLDGLLEKLDGRPVFAVIDTQDEASRKILTRRGFQMQGEDFTDGQKKTADSFQKAKLIRIRPLYRYSTGIFLIS